MKHNQNRIFSLSAMTFMALAMASDVYSADNQSKLIDYATVTSVTPVYHMIEERIPKEHCWIDKVREETHYQRHQPAGGKVIGGIIGGAVGHAVGNGRSNKQLGAVVGSVIGASIGHQKDKQASRPAYTSVNYRNIERCEIKEIVESRRELVGYDVDYSYDNRSFSTRMNQHPGDKIRVVVHVEPIEG